MTKAFNDFLKSHAVKKELNEIVTHTRIGDKKSIYGGSYHINEIDHDSFLELYFRDIVLQNKIEYLTEKQLLDDGPILIDLDFKYDASITERQHTSEHIQTIIRLYFEELDSMYQFDNNVKISAYVLEKPSVNQLPLKKITKDGIHIIIGLKVNRLCQIILRTRIIEKIKCIWNDLPIINSWDDVFDEGITKGTVNWQLYGSRKPDNEAYKITSIYEIYQLPCKELIYDKINIDSINTIEKLMKLSARYNDNPVFFMTDDFLDDYMKIEATIVETPKIVTIPNKSIFNNKSSNYNFIKNENDVSNAVQTFLLNLQGDDYELRDVYNYTMLLPECYYCIGSFNKWIRVGWALFNKNPILFIVWIAFSSQEKDFDYSSISSLWEKWQTFGGHITSSITIRSIIYWAKEYDPIKFELVRSESIDHYINDTLSSISSGTGDKKKNNNCGCGDFDIAKVLYQVFKNDYVCVNITKCIWYHFLNQKWTTVDSGTSLRKSISIQLKNLYYKKSIEINDYISTLSSDDKRIESLKKKLAIIFSICEKCSNTPSKNSIMVEAKELFYDGTFLDRLDQNPYLLCFNNAVVDFKTNEIRNGRPEDCLSRCTNINYIPINECHHGNIINEINEFMTQLFPDPELLQYMWDHLASTLIGTCKEQTINMYVGIGQNGKSVLVNLMEHVLGEYKGDVPLSLITQQRTKIGGLSPELVQLKGVRYAVIQEPSKGDKINEGIMKQLTGGDPVQARAPYMLQILTYIPQFKLVVCSNEFMDIQSQDHGTWRRIRVVDFESLFTEKPVSTDIRKPYQYLLDKDIKEKFHLWKEVFASMLIKIAFRTNGSVKDCEKVLKSSKSYREAQDSITEFLNNRVCKNPLGCLSKVVVNEQFREWFSSNRGGKSPTMKEICIQADRLFGNSYDGVWKGYQIKPTFVMNNISDIDFE